MFPSKQYLKIQLDFEILHMGHDTLKSTKKFNQNWKIKSMAWLPNVRPWTNSQGINMKRNVE
jgi:hypothetical protein